MEAVGRIIEWLADKLKIAGAVCLVGMMFLTCADVVGRFFRHPILGSVELVTFMAALSAGRVVSPAASSFLLGQMQPIGAHRWGLGRIGASSMAILLASRRASILLLAPTMTE